MKSLKLYSALIVSYLLISCGSNSGNKIDFSIITNAEKDKISNNKTLELSIKNPKNHTIESVTYSLNGNTISEKTDLSKTKLGKQIIEATVKFNGDSQTVTKKITILNNKPPKIYKFKIVNTYPHDITSFTQGLEFYKGDLYEGTGQKGESKLRKVNYKTGEVLKNIDLANDYFGEGITVLNDKIYQLTWQNGTGFVYDVNSFEKTGSFKYGKSKEGWGICNDKTKLYKSDGTEKIWLLNPETLTEESYIQATHNRGKINELNELEWVNGKIYANRWNKNGVAIINPENGAIDGVIDFSSLKAKVKQHEKLDVLNGIAYNPDTKTIFVTGKRWDKLFEIELVE